MPVTVAVIGCGAVSHAYLANLVTFPDVQVLACADLDVERARSVAARYGVPHAGAPDVVLNHPNVELVVNLTAPTAHVEVSSAAVAAGKHVYTEKPLCLDVQAGRTLLADAAAAGMRIGSAPDTFLGTGLQSAYQLIARGDIGAPQSALLVYQSAGPQGWHQDPEFLFQPGGGPLFDVGPYYLAAAAPIFGAVTSVAATARQAFDERTVARGPRAGTRFPVTVPTHVTGLLTYASGAAATSVFSFDAPASRRLMEINGTEATLQIPDPNKFDGAMTMRRLGEKEWRSIPTGGSSVGRGMGVLDMARAIRSGTPHRTPAANALHVVETMSAFVTSADHGQFVPVETPYATAEPLPPGWDPCTCTI